MGACASGGENKQLRLNDLIKIQSVSRTFLAKKKLKQIREDKLRQLFSNQYYSIVNTAIGCKRPISQIHLSGHPCDADYMYAGWNNIEESHTDEEQQLQLTQRPFVLTEEQFQQVQNDGVERVYIDEFQDVGEGKKYKGQWKRNSKQRDGLGVQLWQDGSKYEGMWGSNVCNGTGRMTHANGDIYQGEWSKDMANGQGTFEDTQGAKYIGQWMNDLQHGKGEESWSNGATKYIGDFYKGKKNGKGRFEWEDGSFYEGDFVDGFFQGYGRYYFADLDKWYEGEFRMSNMEGRGIETWNDGRKYEGDFKNGKKDGEGTFMWPNGNKYFGSWKSDKQHGIGIYYNTKENSKKQGEWVNGKRLKWLQ